MCTPRTIRRKQPDQAPSLRMDELSWLNYICEAQQTTCGEQQEICYRQPRTNKTSHASRFRERVLLCVRVSVNTLKQGMQRGWRSHIAGKTKQRTLTSEGHVVLTTRSVCQQAGQLRRNLGTGCLSNRARAVLRCLHGST